ncbi:MAG: MFS transporter [Cyclobacteriaceae bacterium]
MSNTKPAKTYTSQFWLLCVSSVLFFSSFSMIIPELPEFLTNLGGADYKGFIISLFTLTAMLSRPFSGKLTDLLGRKPVMIVGSLVCFVCSFLYPILTTVAGFFLLRLIHGFSTGFTPTGVAAYITDTIPANKRGEAMGWIGTAGAVGMAGGPALGGAVANNFGLEAMFYISSFFALGAVAIMIRMAETLPQRKKVGWNVLKVVRNDVFEPSVVAPSLVMLLTAYAYGAVFTLLPDFGAFVGIKNKGLLFTFLTVSSLLIRLLAGKASDRYGRVAVLRFSVPLMIVAMLTLGFATNIGMLIAGSILYGLAQGSTSPTLLAWATDLCDEQHRGRGIASFYIFMEFGIGLGALASSFIYANDSTRFFWAFVVCAALCGGAFLYLISQSKKVYER